MANTENYPTFLAIVSCIKELAPTSEHAFQAIKLPQKDLWEKVSQTKRLLMKVRSQLV